LIRPDIEAKGHCPLTPANPSIGRQTVVFSKNDGLFRLRAAKFEERIAGLAVRFDLLAE